MILMYTIKCLDQNKVQVFLHEDCEVDIHSVAQDAMHYMDEGNGAEYTVQPDGSAIIAIF